MGPMVRGEKLNKRRLTKLAAVGIIAMFTWSLIAAPASQGQDEAVSEPDEISSYFTFGDAAPISGYIDHQALPAPAFGPGLAHTSTSVELPSEASAIAWLLDAGIANGLHGTTTGASVPTEVNAKQPGGDSKAEFTTAGGPVGEEEFGRVAAGVARVSALHSDSPRGFGTAYFSDVCLFPAAGSPPEPPGTYDPDATFPGGDNQKPVKDPGPLARQCIVSAASIASTSQSIRENDTVTSISVAEISGITIGDRTSDNRCTNCFYIDAMRVEAFAQANGQPGGSKAGYRLMFGRACRRAFVPGTTNTIEETILGALGQPTEEIKAHEEDQCLGNPSREGFPEGNADAGDEILNEVPAPRLNEFFDKPVILGEVPCPGTMKNCRIAIRVNAGEPNTDPTRAEHTSSPPEDVCRNYAYPDPNPKAKENADCKALGVQTGVDKDQGQEAKAVAEGLDIDILTLTASQVIPPNEDLETCLENRIPAQLYDNEQFGTLYGTVKDQVGCPIAGLRSIRELNLTFGVAQAGAVARPGFELPEGGGEGGGFGGIIPPITPPVGPGTDIGGGTGGGGVQVIGGGGLGGKYGLKIDWKSLKIKPWPAKDLAKALFAGAIIAGMVWLIRRRLRHA